MKLKHHVSAHMKRNSLTYTSLGALVFASLFLVGTFFITRNKIPMSELSFVEHSLLGKEAGSVVPASCESGQYHTDLSRYPWHNTGMGLNSAPAQANSPSPRYYSTRWFCQIWLWNYGSYPSLDIGPGTDAQAWAQCKSLYDSYAGYNREMTYFGTYPDGDGLYNPSCYTPPAPSASFTSAPGCSIPAGLSYCYTTLSWTFANATDGTIDLTDSSNGGYLRGTTGTSGQVYVPYSAGWYNIRDHGTGAVLAEVGVASSCASGTTWNGSVCAAPPSVNLQIQ